MPAAPLPSQCNPAPHHCESSDDSYDSEEERVSSRMQASGHKAALRAEQAAQAELLRAYRARQQVQQRLREEAVLSKLQQQRLCGDNEWESSGYGPNSHQQQDAAAGRVRSGQPGTSAWLPQLQQHEGLWAALEQRSLAFAAGDHGGGSPASIKGDSGSSTGTGGRGLSYADVPWPPLECRDYLQGLAVLEQRRRATSKTTDQPGAPSMHEQHQRAQRRAYTRACLRWHPDKFAGRWGRMLLDADRPRILQRVQQLSQGINQAWEALQEEQL